MPGERCVCKVAEVQSCAAVVLAQLGGRVLSCHDTSGTPFPATSATRQQCGVYSARPSCVGRSQYRHDHRVSDTASRFELKVLTMCQGLCHSQSTGKGPPFESFK